jgi:hypothetical protein
MAIPALILLYGVPQMAAETPADPPAASAAAAPKADSKSKGEHGAGRVGVGFRASSLGLGGEVAVEVTRTSNLRGGISGFSYSRGFDQNGIHYYGDLRWLSAEAHYDWFPFTHLVRSFHLSPGLIAYNDNHVNASASTMGGYNFTLNHVAYFSDPADPVGGTGKLSFNKAAPTFMVGFGNLVPRKGKHVSVNIEAGVAFAGSPKIGLNLTGSACLPGTSICQNVGTTPSIQSNVVGEQTVISNDLSPFKYYPLVALTIGYRL